MKKNYLPIEKSDCPHNNCSGQLMYYHEIGENDLYYCSCCYGLAVWDGNKIERRIGEAYPDRKKS